MSHLPAKLNIYRIDLVADCLWNPRIPAPGDRSWGLSLIRKALPSEVFIIEQLAFELGEDGALPRSTLAKEMISLEPHFICKLI